MYEIIYVIKLLLIPFIQPEIMYDKKICYSWEGEMI